MKAFLFFTALFSALCANAFDTLFVASYSMPGMVNIDAYQDILYIRTTNEILTFERGNFQTTNIETEKRYSWILEDGQFGKAGFYHTQYIPEEKSSPASLKAILPGNFYSSISTAQIKDRLFVAYNQKLLEYRVDKHYTLELPGWSIRSVWCNDSIRYVAAYGGIFYHPDKSDFSEIPLNNPLTYSNGEINLVDDRLFISYDHLGVLSDSSFSEVKQARPDYQFRAMRQWNDLLIGVRARGIEIMDQDLETLEILFEHELIGDALVIDDNLFVGTASGRLYKLNKDMDIVDSTHIHEIIDLAFAKDTINVSTIEGVVRVSPDLEVLEEIDLAGALQTVEIGNYLIISTLNGLYAYHGDKLITLIPNVEFNKKALFLHGHDLYAGSAQGLYLLKRYYIEDVLLPNVYENVIEENKSNSLIWTIPLSLVVAALLAGLIQRSKKPPLLEPSLDTYDLKIIEGLVRENPSIQSVSHLAETLQTSTVQLNRKFKKHDTTPGNFIKNVKRTIAREMHASGHNIHSIASRVGYSERYVKEKFLR